MFCTLYFLRMHSLNNRAESSCYALNHLCSKSWLNTRWCKASLAAVWNVRTYKHGLCLHRTRNLRRGRGHRMHHYSPPKQEAIGATAAVRIKSSGVCREREISVSSSGLTKWDLDGWRWAGHLPPSQKEGTHGGAQKLGSEGFECKQNRRVREEEVRNGIWNKSEWVSKLIWGRGIRVERRERD